MSDPAALQEGGKAANVNGGDFSGVFMAGAGAEDPCREVVRKVQGFCSELKLKIPGSILCARFPMP